jgi:hypothetical protein
MSSSLALRGTVSLFLATVVLLPLLPGGQIRVAEGCSGAGGYTPQPPACMAPGWHKITAHFSASHVPTDAGVILLTESDPSTCAGYPPDSSLTGIAVDSANAQTPGTFTVLPSPDYARTLLWRPSTPLTPGASYTLQVTGAGGGGAGAGGSGGTVASSFLFTMANGPLTPGFVPMKISSGVGLFEERACCPAGLDPISASCGEGFCELVGVVSALSMSVKVAPSQPDFAFVVLESFAVKADGSDPYSLLKIGGLTLPYAPEFPVPFSTWANSSRPCLEIHQTYLGSTFTTTSGVLCPDEKPLPPPELHCDKKAKLVAECAKVSKTPDLTPFDKYCNGSAGAGGMAGAAGVVGTGGGNATGGSTAGLGGSTASDAAAPSDGSSGCSTSPARTGSTTSLSLFVAALAAAAKRRRDRATS